MTTTTLASVTLARRRAKIMTRVQPGYRLGRCRVQEVPGRRDNPEVRLGSLKLVRAVMASSAWPGASRASTPTDQMLTVRKGEPDHRSFITAELNFPRGVARLANRPTLVRR
jgi:hypothetical protein